MTSFYFGASLFLFIFFSISNNSKIKQHVTNVTMINRNVTQFQLIVRGKLK